MTVKPEPLTAQQYQVKSGQEIGLSDWILVDQERIDRFAEVTEDRNFIHTDPERAKFIHLLFERSVGLG